MLENLSGRKFVACCVALALLNTYTLSALASPGAVLPKGDLSVTGRVSLNGQDAISGTTVFPASNIVTAEDSSASVSLPALGHITLQQNTNLSLDYGASEFSGSLNSGCAEFSAVAGVPVKVSAGTIRIASDAADVTSFSVKVVGDITTVTALRGKLLLYEGRRQLPINAGQFYSTGMDSPATDGQQPQDNDDHKERKLLFLLAGVGAVIVAIIVVTTRNNNTSTLGGNGGGGINPSPTS
jgi:ferric-dicitrate binding protein FerR (iron transport regulator)